jgi:geranylgeranyl reductase family
MRSQRSNIAVIGGGPAGSKAAALLAKEHTVTVVEEHSVSGLPVQCTGLVSDDVLDLCGVNIDVLNSLYGAHVHFPNGGVISSRSNKRKAVLIDRYELDRKMADAAQDAGAEYLYNTKYRSHVISRDSVKIDIGSDMEADMIIGADGHRSNVSKVQLGNNNAKEYIKGIQADLKHVCDDQEMMNIFLGSDVAPGFFAWVIPFGEFTRVGLCCRYDSVPMIHLKNLLKKAGLESAEVKEKHCGMIPLGGRPCTYGERLLLIGDSAGQVKPVSGGGLYPAFRSSYCLRDTVNEAFSSGDFSSGSLEKYETRWKKEVGKELRNGYAARRMYKKVDDRGLNEIYEAVNTPGVHEVLNDINIDNPSDVIFPIMKNFQVMAKALPAFLKAVVRR